MERFEPGDICIWKPGKPRAGYYGLNRAESMKPVEVVVSSGPSKRGLYVCEIVNDLERKKFMPKCGRLQILKSRLSKIDN